MCRQRQGQAYSGSARGNGFALKQNFLSRCRVLLINQSGICIRNGLRRPRRLSMSTSLIHQYSTASACVQARSGQRGIIRETAVKEVSRKAGETFTQRIEGRILSESLVHQCERIIGLTSVQSDLHGLRRIATACLYRASGPAGSRQLRDSPQTPQRPIRCNPKQG